MEIVAELEPISSSAFLVVLFWCEEEEEEEEKEEKEEEASTTTRFETHVMASGTSRLAHGSSLATESS